MQVSHPRTPSRGSLRPPTRLGNTASEGAAHTKTSRPENGNGSRPKARQNGFRQSPIRSRMHGEDRRQQLIDVAIQVFGRNGFSGTKTKDIAAAAGVSEAILFHHFASKED